MFKYGSSKEFGLSRRISEVGSNVRPVRLFSPDQVSGISYLAIESQGTSYVLVAYYRGHDHATFMNQSILNGKTRYGIRIWFEAEPEDKYEIGILHKRTTVIG